MIFVLAREQGGSPAAGCEDKASPGPVRPQPVLGATTRHLPTRDPKAPSRGSDAACCSSGISWVVTDVPKRKRGALWQLCLSSAGAVGVQPSLVGLLMCKPPSRFSC